MPQKDHLEFDPENAQYAQSPKEQVLALAAKLAIAADNLERRPLEHFPDLPYDCRAAAEVLRGVAKQCM